MSSCNKLPPDIKKIPYEMESHGHKRIDDYYWMRLTDEQKSAEKYDGQTQDVVNYISKETDYLNNSLKHTKKLQNTLYDEMVGRKQVLTLSRHLYALLEMHEQIVASIVGVNPFYLFFQTTGVITTIL